MFFEVKFFAKDEMLKRNYEDIDYTKFDLALIFICTETIQEQKLSFGLQEILYQDAAFIKNIFEEIEFVNLKY